MRITCPRCGTETTWEGNENRPFCGENCRIIDLGRWVTESYRIPVKDQDEDEDGSPSRETQDPAE